MHTHRHVHAHVSVRFAVLISATVLALTSHAQPVPEGRRLRTIASEAGLYLGAALNSNYATKPDTAAYQLVAGREFNFFCTENEMKMRQIQPTRDNFFWTNANAATQFASAKGGDMRYHFLIGGPASYAAPWMIDMANNPAVTPAEMSAVMRKHISTAMNHWPLPGSTSPDNMKMWEVLNEIFPNKVTTSPGAAREGWKTGLRHGVTGDQQDIWLTKIGDGYIEAAFREAALHKNPGDLLMYNDNNTEALGLKSDHVYQMVKDFTTPGRSGGVVPINSIGFQCHMKDVPFDPASVRANFDRFSALGMELFITELDWRIEVGLATESVANLMDRQARLYHQIFDAALRSPGFGGTQLWGFTDNYTWLGSEKRPLIFDATYNAKPSYYAIQDALEMQSRDQTLGNASFEDNSLWTGNGAALSYTGTAAHSGQQALRVSNRVAAWAGPRQDVTEALKSRGAGRYFLRGWARVPAGTANVKLTLRLDDSGTVPVYLGTPGIPVGSNWTLVSGWVNVAWFKQLTAATVYAETTAGTMDFFLDDVHLGDGNLVLNADFENSTLTNWTQKGAATLNPTSATNGPYTYHYGEKGLSVTARGADWSGASQDIAARLRASGHGEYRLSAYMKLHSGTANGKLTLRLRSNNTDTYYAITDAISGAKWNRISGTVNLNWTGSLQEAELYVETPGITTSYFLDDVILRR
jgi:endo-1,4-beta-xylanase